MMEIIQTSLNTKENPTHEELRLLGNQFPIHDDEQKTDKISSGSNCGEDCCYQFETQYNNNDLAIEKNQIEKTNIQQCQTNSNNNKNKNKNNSSSRRIVGQRPPKTAVIDKTRSNCQTEVVRNMLIALTTFKVSLVLSILSQPLMMICLAHLLGTVGAWMPDIRPDLPAKPDKVLAKFVGNSTDYFKILDHDDATILVGAKDVVYNISLNGLKELNRIEWYSSDADKELCALKGKRETDCHNYIRVFARLADDQMLLCGTNSYKPRCRHYAPLPDEAQPMSSTSLPSRRHPGSHPLSYEYVRDVEAQGLCPYSPVHNSTYAFADGKLYSATVADFSGGDPLIYRENLRTEQYDLKQLNQPDFVGAIERNGFVLFFFREVAMEYMHIGKIVYSRVGRVCKNDRGGPYTLSKSWTSFLKARLNCSIPGEFPFYFDEIQSISPVIENGPTALIYAVFTTSVNAISGSAICAFNVDDIMEAFQGRFKSQRDSQSQWLPVQEEQVPVPRPGQCVDDSRTMSSIAVNFVKNHPLMEMAVPPVYGRPLLTKVHLHQRWTTIAVDSQVPALDGEFYDVIYAGTDDGRVTKFFNIASNGGSSPSQRHHLRTVVISERQVLPSGIPIRELTISAKTNTLLVVSDGLLVTVPLHHCNHRVDCVSCLALQDPSCAWDHQTHECKNLVVQTNHKFGTKTFLQSLNTTVAAAKLLCPKAGESIMPPDAAVVNLGALTDNTLHHQAHVTARGHHHHSEDKTEDDMVAKFNVLINKKVPMIAGGEAMPGVVLDVETGEQADVRTPTYLDLPSAVGGDFLLDAFNEDNKITLHSVDPEDLMGGSFVDPLQATAHVDEAKQLQLAGRSFYWGFGALALALMFIVGVIVGLHVAKRNCRPSGLHNSHRNQFNSHPQFGLKHGKDINLLMNPNHYCQTKQPNLDLEKDRSHECKNSTENLEKELPCKTSTLTKVKRTYI